MPNVHDVGDRATKWIRWIARIWGTLIVAFTLLVLIGYAWNWVTTGKADPHAAEDYPPIENLPPLFALLSVLGLGLAWRWEGLGAAITVVFNLAGLPVLLIHWPIAHDFPRHLVAPLWYVDDNRHSWNTIPDVLVAIEKEGNSSARRITTRSYCPACHSLSH